MRSEFLMKVNELTSQQQAMKSKKFAKTKLQGCAKLLVNRQSETSLGKGKKGGKNLTLHMEGFQNLQKHVEGFWNLLKKQLKLIHNKSPCNFINLK